MPKDACHQISQNILRKNLEKKCIKILRKVKKFTI
jgi:hypothetical protein